MPEHVIAGPRLEWRNPGGELQVHPLDDAEVVLGRKADVDIMLDNQHISRRHARIARTDNGYSVEDMGSTYGTFVNEQAVERATLLRHGDKISLGKDRITLLYFEDETDFPVPPAGATISETSLEQSLAGLGLVLPPELSELEKISFLLGVQYQWGQVFTPERTFEQILQSALKISGAERGFILLREGEALAYRIGFNLKGRRLSHAEFRTSHTVVEQVKAEGKPVFMAEGIRGALAEQASILAMRLKALACLPLHGLPAEASGAPELRGILYLDSKRAMHTLSGLDEKILTKLAEEAGHVLEKVELIQAFEERKKMEQELALAEETQRGLLPQTLPQLPNLRVQAFAKPTRHVGGDFYDFLARGPGELVGVLGDVTGKGVPAALLSSMLLGCLGLQFRLGLKLSEAINHLNKVLCEKPSSNRFATLFLFALDREGRGRFISAGHLPAYLFRSATGEIEELESNNLLLGAFPSASFQSAPLELGPGDVLLVYSDGLTEAEDPDGEMFGAERTREIIRLGAPAGAEVLKQKLLSAIQDFTEDRPQTDDITMVIVERVA